MTIPREARSLSARDVGRVIRHGADELTITDVTPSALIKGGVKVGWQSRHGRGVSEYRAHALLTITGAPSPPAPAYTATEKQDRLDALRLTGCVEAPPYLKDPT